ncbi:hypothetical protein C3L33_09318, partial [Rhododendron williamsianum]
MRWWRKMVVPMRRIWIVVAKGVGIRKTGKDGFSDLPLNFVNTTSSLFSVDCGLNALRVNVSLAIDKISQIIHILCLIRLIEHVYTPVGLVKLRQEVRTCEYQDVHVLWEMLNRMKQS